MDSGVEGVWRWSSFLDISRMTVLNKRRLNTCEEDDYYLQLATTPSQLLRLIVEKMMSKYGCVCELDQENPYKSIIFIYKIPLTSWIASAVGSSVSCYFIFSWGLLYWVILELWHLFKSNNNKDDFTTFFL